ncbi:MAG: hypothetical protein GY953_42890 [bacterium]|nr:hypothetical protein [bacterium]
MTVPKFSLLEEVDYPHHRSGWKCSMAALKPLLRANGDGTLLDPSIERHFGRWLARSRRAGLLPYRGPWVGFVHCPPRIPAWHSYRYSPSYYFRLKTWQTGLPLCRGLITLSDWMADWLRRRVSVPVLSVKHPTETPPVTFDLDRFQSHGRVIQIGWAFRRLCSVYYLPLRRLRKALLLPWCADELALTPISPGMPAVAPRDRLAHSPYV